ncbi:MAG: tetratricopeptide repeat protein [Rhodocyclaceae bacterium]|nr:tetratricopeptide repeat protein [Rhodocyclaceae bacterium]
MTDTARAEAEALFHDGNRRMRTGDLAGAEACFREALRLLPDFAEALGNLGLLLEGRGAAAAVEAEACYRRSLELNPNYPQMHLNLGALLLDRKCFAAAETAFLDAIQLDPASPVGWTALGVLLACTQREAEAERRYRSAMTLDGRYAAAQFNLAYLLLRQGRFEEGWRRLEARDWYAALQMRLACPRWQGEALAGKSLLIGFEAGHGDMIQFCRYAAVLKAQGAARIGLVCHPPLKSLFATLAGVDAVFAFDEDVDGADWDCWTPPLSIPYHCRTRLDTIPAALPYLHATPERIARWAGELPAGGLRVGLAWRGNPRFENDADRSLASLAVLAPLGAVAGVRFVSLQKGAGEDEAAHPPPGLPLVDLGSCIEDFADTAAIIAGLDLVISVDTAVAHLAGALGKRCWVLLPDYKTDWRWLTERGDSPWYPQVMRLFRQPAGGDWTPVVAELAAALEQLARADS